VKIYQEITADIPDEVFFKASRECLRRLRFFPTPAEFLEVAQPILQEYNLARLKLLEADILGKCRDNVKYMAHENGQDSVECPLNRPVEEGGCEYNGGKCKRWEFLNDLRAEAAAKKKGGPF